MTGKKPKKEENSEELFLRAYDEHSAAIYRHIYFRVNRRELAEDLTSETFVKTWNYLRGDEEIKNLKSFLYRVSNNLIIDYYRSKHKEAISLESVTEPKEPRESGAAVKTDEKMDFELVRKSLDSLPQDYRQIIIYRFIDELSIKEISKLTEKSYANIYVIIHRALRQLKKNLSPYRSGGTPEATGQEKNAQ